MMSAGIAANSVTGRTDLTSRKKECPKYIK